MIISERCVVLAPSHLPSAQPHHTAEPMKIILLLIRLVDIQLSSPPNLYLSPIVEGGRACGGDIISWL